MRTQIIDAIARRAGGGGTDPVHTADAVVGALKALHGELSLVVGAQAAASLCAHAMHRTRARFNWDIGPAAHVSDTVLSALRRDLAQRSPEESLNAGETLLLALVEHLVSLIGEPLTHRMLQSAWTVSDATQTSQENL